MRLNLVNDASAGTSGSFRLGQDVRVLIVDDVKNIRSTLTVYLESLGCDVFAAARFEAALDAVRREPFDLALVDLRLGADNGLDLISHLCSMAPTMVVALITAFSNVDIAADARRRGARVCIPKPFSPSRIDELLLSVTKLAIKESPAPR